MKLNLTRLTDLVSGFLFYIGSDYFPAGPWYSAFPNPRIG